MSRRRFEEILGIHCTYNKEYPPYTDRFHPIRDFVKVWNDNMKTNFSPSWIVCLDESMSLWTNMFTCPGFVFCPRKPWDKGNEYHTIACEKSSILFFAEIVEGKGKNFLHKNFTTLARLLVYYLDWLAPFGILDELLFWTLVSVFYKVLQSWGREDYMLAPW